MPRFIAFSLLSAGILIFSSYACFAYDMYNITKPQHKISISGDVGSNIVLGTGLNLDDPLRPIPSPTWPFAASKVTAANQGPIDLPSIFSSTTSFVQEVSDDEFARVIYANLNGSFSVIKTV
jgi:hypothetical protein